MLLLLAAFCSSSPLILGLLLRAFPTQRVALASLVPAPLSLCFPGSSTAYSRARHQRHLLRTAPSWASLARSVLLKQGGGVGVAWDISGGGQQRRAEEAVRRVKEGERVAGGSKRAGSGRVGGGRGNRKGGRGRECGPVVEGCGRCAGNGRRRPRVGGG